jgi:hypothetical protein
MILNMRKFQRGLQGVFEALSRSALDVQMEDGQCKLLDLILARAIDWASSVVSTLALASTFAQKLNFPAEV